MDVRPATRADFGLIPAALAAAFASEFRLPFGGPPLWRMWRDPA
jgi:hypothetical protein